MSEGKPADPAYIIGHTDSELRRLIIQDQLYRPSTRELFVSAGISAGMKVLDVGSGAGDVALLVADLVGPSGQVVGVEMNAHALETAQARVQAAGWANITFLHGDVRSAPLAADFDAVVGRWVLLWVADPADLLRQVARHLRPGGIVAFQDNDFSFGVTSFPETPLFRQVFRFMSPEHDQIQAHGGPEYQMGLKLYQTYLAAGLPAPQLLYNAPIGGGPNWTGYDYIAYTMRTLLPQLEQLGIATAAGMDVDTLADRLRAEAVANHAVATLPAVIGAWARTGPAMPG